MKVLILGGEISKHAFIAGSSDSWEKDGEEERNEFNFFPLVRAGVHLSLSWALRGQCGGSSVVGIAVCCRSFQPSSSTLIPQTTHTWV